METISKFRQKRLKGLGNKSKSKETASIGSYLYPKNDLYTREEFELLDTIYSDEPPVIDQSKEIKQEVPVAENFWPENKEEYLNITNNKNNFFTNLGWFLSGVALTSVVWLIYFQINVHEIRTKNDTQIVFQKSANIMTDKTIDKEVSKQLKDKKSIEEQSKSSNLISKYLANLFSKKTPVVKPPVTEPQKIEPVRFYTVGNGDSLWVIANKYYSNPSPGNINKIMKANSMKRVSTLLVGQRLVIPQ